MSGRRSPALYRPPTWATIYLVMVSYAITAVTLSNLVPVAYLPLIISLALLVGVTMVVLLAQLFLLARVRRHVPAARALAAHTCLILWATAWYWCGEPWWRLCARLWASWRLLTPRQRRRSMLVAVHTLIVLEFGGIWLVSGPATVVLVLFMTIACLPFLLIMLVPAYFGIRQNIRDERAERR